MFVRALLATGVVAAVSLLATASTEATIATQPPLYLTAARLFDGVHVVRGGAVVEVRTGRIVAAGKIRVPRPVSGLFGSATRRSCRASSIFTSTKAQACSCARASPRPAMWVREASILGRRTPRRATRTSLRPSVVTVPGGYPTGRDPARADPITSPAEGATQVDKLVSKGAALIKIALEDGGNNTLPMLSVAEVQAIVAEAHKLRRIVTAHVLEGPGLAIALAGGVDELAHMPCQDVTSDQMTTLLQRHIPVVGTLHIDQLYVGLGSACRWACERKDLRGRRWRTALRHRYSRRYPGARPDGTRFDAAGRALRARGNASGDVQSRP